LSEDLAFFLDIVLANRTLNRKDAYSTPSYWVRV